MHSESKSVKEPGAEASVSDAATSASSAATSVSSAATGLNHQESSADLTVLFDGSCPLCRREISHLQGLAEKTPGHGLCFLDISQTSGSSAEFAAERDQLLARFHVQRADGSRLDGAAAFVAMWGRLPGWRWLARLSRIPGALPVMEWSYRGFLKLRPGLQRMVSKLEQRRGA